MDNIKIKKQDLLFTGGCVLVLLPFFLSKDVYNFYKSFNAAHPFIASAIKFALLSTAGERIGLRIRKGFYNERGFGIIPRAIVWAALGMAIKAAFIIFSEGVPRILADVWFGPKAVLEYYATRLSFIKIFTAFSISLAMNTIFAPVFMTLHKITDTHILQTGGTLRGFFTPIPFGKIISSMDWQRQWDFVFKKTIPLFWIPAHTITFLLPPDWQVLFAAALGVALGVLLALASRK